MSPRISRIYPLLLALCLLLPSCTLLDNDLRPESEKQEAAPDTTNYIHEQTDEYTASYQYSDQTRVLDEQFLSYVAGIDYSLGTLYLEDFTPDALLPVAGQILAGPICNQLPYGLAHHVVSVTHQNTLYEVRIKRAYIDEVFSHLELEGEFAALSDSLIEDSMDLGNGVKVTRATASDDKDLGGEERGTTLTFTVSSGISSKAIEGLSVTGSAGITLDFRWKPINKVHVYTNTDTNVLDVKLTNGATFTHYITIDGNVALNFDLFEFLQLKELFKKIFHVPLGATVGLPIFLDIYPTLVLSAEVNGRIGMKMIKTFYTDIGAAYGVKGKSNGITFKNHNKELTFEEMPPAEDYAEFYGKAGGSVSAKLGLTADLYFGSPLEQPRVGVKAQVTCGPRIMTSIDTETNGYDDMWKFGFPLNIDGIFYFDLFKKIDPLEWNFVDYLAKAFGQKNGSEFWEFGKQEFRFYPSIDNMRIVCANNMESGSVPQFNVDFDVLTNGSKTGTRIGFRPIYRIFPHNYSSAEPIVEFDPHQYTTFRQGLHFSFPINSNLLQRDEIYDLEIAMVKPGLPKEEVMYTRRFPFTSTSPTAFINDWKKTAQWEHQSKQMRNGGYTCYYDYDFVTYVHFEGREKVKRWGFLVNGKKYEITDPPVKDDVAVRWSIEKSKKSKRDIKLTPYIVYQMGDQEYTTNMAPYTVSLSYDKSLNTVKNEWEGRKYKDDKDYDDYVRSGFDINGEVKADVDFQTK